MSGLVQRLMFSLIYTFLLLLLGRQPPSMRKRLTHLCFVLAAAALKGLVSEVGDGDEAAQVTHVNTVGVRRFKEALSQELRSTMGNLTISFHLPESQTSITGRQKHAGIECAFPSYTLLQPNYSETLF